jgi:hypothetical protein
MVTRWAGEHVRPKRVCASGAAWQHYRKVNTYREGSGRAADGVWAVRGEMCASFRDKSLGEKPLAPRH